MFTEKRLSREDLQAVNDLIITNLPAFTKSPDGLNRLLHVFNMFSECLEKDVSWSLLPVSSEVRLIGEGK